MSRVSQNSSAAALQFSTNKAKARLEDLQMKGASLRKIIKPSDDPIGNIDSLTIKSRQLDGNQYKRNVGFAITHLEFTENAVSDLVDIAMKAKDLAITQSSDIYNPEVRQSVAREISQLKKQALAVGNRRLGNKYIFGGFKTLDKPFNHLGEYKGDTGHSFVEVSKDFFIPINLTGVEVFIGANNSRDTNQDPLAELKTDPSHGKLNTDDIANPEAPATEEATPKDEVTPPAQALPKRTVASTNVTHSDNFLSQLQTLEDALNTNNSDAVQELLEQLDTSLDRLITLRTKIGSMTNSVRNAEVSMEKSELLDEAQKSHIEDADVAKLFSDLEKEKNILMATYKTGSQLISKSLVDFLR